MVPTEGERLKTTKALKIRNGKKGIRFVKITTREKPAKGVRKGSEKKNLKGAH